MLEEKGYILITVYNLSNLARRRWGRDDDGKDE